MMRHLPLATCTTMLLLVLQGCGGTTPPRIEPLSSLSQDRWTPGEKMAASLEDTTKKTLCSFAQPGGKVFLEAAEVAPRTISPGDRIYHRLWYVVCPEVSVHPVKGKIIRTVQLRKTKIFEDVTEHAFKSGSWVVDAAIVVPEGAQGGEYTIDVALTVGKSQVKRGSTFVVKKQK